MNIREQYKYKKVMLMSVGTGRTGKDIAHGLYFSIDDHNPNYVYFIVTEISKKNTFPYLEEIIKKKKPELVYELIEENETNDIQKLFRSYTKTINNLLQKGFTKENITVDFTSGTKAMSSALVSAALSLEVKKLSYVYGDRGEGGRVKSGTERINSLYPSAIFTAKKLNRFVALFNLFQFEGAIKLLFDEDIHPDFTDVTDVLIKMAKVYSAWDKFDFKKSFNLMKEIKIDLVKKINLKSKLETDKNILSNLLDDKMTYNKIYDLLANAERRDIEGKYDDGMARLYRLLEMIAQIEFEKTFDCTTSNVELDKIDKKHHDKLKHKYYDSITKKYKIPLAYAFTILADANNKIGENFKNNQDEIKKLLGQRNLSILAHGSVPIKKSGFEDMLNFIKNNFITLLPKNKLQESYKFPFIKKTF